MKNLLRLLAGLKVSVKTNPTLVRGTVVLDIHPDDIPQKDKTLAKAANYISMVENAGKLGGVLHSDGSVGPKETANCLLNSMKLTGKDDMVSSLFDLFCLFGFKFNFVCLFYFNLFLL
jgi:hypothetical protein